MKCSKADRLAHVYFDGEMDWATQAELRQHLEGCQFCASQYKLVNQRLTAIRTALAPQVVPPDFTEKVMERIIDVKSNPEKNSTYDLLRRMGVWGLAGWVAEESGGQRNWADIYQFRDLWWQISRISNSYYATGYGR